jgi:hypothetical protein
MLVNLVCRYCSREHSPDGAHRQFDPEVFRYALDETIRAARKVRDPFKGVAEFTERSLAVLGFN